MVHKYFQTCNLNNGKSTFSQVSRPYKLLVLQEGIDLSRVWRRWYAAMETVDTETGRIGLSL